MACVFWVSVALLVHTYVLYPLGLILADAFGQARANLRRLREREPEPADSERWPAVSLVVAAYNEAGCIAQKLENARALDYPADRLEILVGSDGSTDTTDAIVSASPDPRVRLSAAPRGGKVAVLNRCIPLARSEVVVLTDANTFLAPDALRALVRPFGDPRVGAVCGHLRLYNPSAESYEESAYWAYESLIKLYEGRRGAVLGANGGLYAIRRTLFAPLPADTIVDDFLIPMRILQAGFEVRYAPGALALEETTEDYRREAGRRARIGAGNFQSLRALWRLLLPSAGFVSYAFWSHKVLRWMAPFLLAMALGANLLLLPRPWAWATLAVQVGFYVLALAGGLGLLARSPLRRPASWAYYFTRMNGALAVGFWRFLRSSQSAAWERTAR